jgi:hypothetical protein
VADRKPPTAKCVNHTRREASQKLLGVDLCGDCAKVALKAALNVEDEPTPLRPPQLTLTTPATREAEASVALDGETQSEPAPDPLQDPAWQAPEPVQ